MIRHDGLVLCDAHLRPKNNEMHGDVVTDGKTILPGYITIKNGIVTQWHSSDHFNRIIDDNGNPQVSTKQIDTYKDKRTIAAFCNTHCYEMWKNTHD